MKEPKKLRQISTNKSNIICYNIIKGDDIMQKMYMKSLQMIKLCNIKTKKEYIELSRNFLILNIESLKWITQKRNFKDIVKIANEV